MIFDKDGVNNGRWRPGENIQLHYYAPDWFETFTREEAVQMIMQNAAMLELWATEIGFSWAGFVEQEPSFSPDSKFTIAVLSQEAFVPRHGPSFVAYAAVWWANYIYDAYQAFNHARLENSEPSKFRRIGLHEFMHNLGFDHDSAPYSIMNNAPYHSTKYQGLLRYPDILQIHEVYGPPNSEPIGHVCADEDLTFYIPAIEHPANGQLYWAELSHRLQGDVHYLRLEDGQPLPEGVRIAPRAAVEAGRLIIEEVFWLGARYGRLVFEAESDELYRLVEAEG